MAIRKFFGAEDAARYAATLTNEWQTEEGEIWDSETLIDVANCADGENPLDEEDDEVYYLVDENGALGYTESNCADIYWWVTPTKIVTHPAPPVQNFCPGCGAKVEPGWMFCDKCGFRLQ